MMTPALLTPDESFSAKGGAKTAVAVAVMQPGSEEKETEEIDSLQIFM